MRIGKGHHWFPNSVCLVLATLIFGGSMLEARVGAASRLPPEETGPERKLTLKERMLEIPPGTMIEVRLREKRKIRGRLGELTDEAFNLTTAEGEKIVTQQIAYTEVKSVKRIEGGKAGKAGHAALYMLAGIGAFIAILVVIALAKSE